MALDMNDFIDLHRLWIVAEYRCDFMFLFSCLDVDVDEECVDMIDDVLNYLQLRTGKELCYVDLAIC